MPGEMPGEKRPPDRHAKDGSGPARRGAQEARAAGCPPAGGAEDALIRLAFDAAPVGIVLSENRVIRAANLTFCRLVGYRREELLGRSFRMLYASRAEFERIRDIGLERLRARGDYSDERLVLRRDGSRFWCRFRAHTLTPEDPLRRTILSFARIAETAPRALLSPRERQVVGLLARGMTSKEAARALGLSPRTIEDVRARLLKKFRARNSSELLAQLTGLEH